MTRRSQTALLVAGALLSVATELHTPELIELFAQSVKG